MLKSTMSIVQCTLCNMNMHFMVIISFSHRPAQFFSHMKTVYIHHTKKSGIVVPPWIILLKNARLLLVIIWLYILHK